MIPPGGTFVELWNGEQWCPGLVHDNKGLVLCWDPGTNTSWRTILDGEPWSGVLPERDRSWRLAPQEPPVHYLFPPEGSVEAEGNVEAGGGGTWGPRELGVLVGAALREANRG